jgi:hypothetical protein
MAKTTRSALIVFSALMFAAGPAVAAEITVGAQTPAQTQAGALFSVDILLNTGDDDINAVGGTINYPTDLLVLREVQDANSIVSLWVDDPKFAYPGKVAFSGIIPGGYRGDGGLLLKLSFLAQKEGQGTVTLSTPQALMNDGNGTAAPLAVMSYAFTVSPSVGGEVQHAPVLQDADPPESFKPEIGRDPAIAENRWFVAFSTQDKGSGIDHYEIKESSPQGLGLSGEWVRAESPYVLRDQTLRSTVIVKAIDRVGNERVEEIGPLHALQWYENYGTWVIIGLCLAVILALLKLVWRVFKRK